MGANTDLAMDAETRQRIDDLRRDVQRDRDRFNAKTLGLRFLGQPVSHPHKGMIWVDHPGYLGGPADWTPHWSRFGGEWLCLIYVPNQDRSDVFSYDVFFDGINEEVCRKFRQHACEVAALLERLGCEPSVGVCRESELVRTLFERNRTELDWEENEEPEHPETKSLIGRLKDIYGHTETFLSDLLEEFTPTSPEQRSQVDKEIEVDRQGGKADNESGPTTMPNAETLALRNEVESGADNAVVRNTMRGLTNVPTVEPGTLKRLELAADSIIEAIDDEPAAAETPIVGSPPLSPPKEKWPREEYARDAIIRLKEKPELQSNISAFCRAIAAEKEVPEIAVSLKKLLYQPEYQKLWRPAK